MRLKKGISIFLLIALLFSSFTTGTAFAVVEKSSPITKEDLLKQLNITPEEQHEAIISQITQDSKMRPSEDTLVIKYNQPISTRIHTQAGAVVKKRVAALNYDIVTITGNKKIEDVINYYRNLGSVDSVMPSVPVQTLSTSFNDPKAKDMYHLNMVNAAKALSLAGKHEVVVAVIDTGMDLKHPELKNQVLTPYNVADPMKRPLADVHGTHVAGIIAAEANNGIGGYGINPNAKILPIDVFNRGWGSSDYIVAEGILYAVNQGAQVINMSLGSYYPSKILEDAVNIALDAGITIVASAGNEGSSTSRYPAAFEGVISVGALNDQTKLASFSNYGPSVDIVAPGEAVYAPFFDVDKHSTFMELSGTSMSAPIVAGVASLLLSKHPNLTPLQVKYILQQTAKDIGTPGYNMEFGFGLVDPVAALQYDVKKLPKFNTASDDLVKGAIEPFIANNEGIAEGHIKLPSQINWYKIPVEAGQKVQLTLEGAKLYDYEMVIKHLGENSEVVNNVKVNDVQEGKIEAYLYNAEEDGTLLIGVKDAFGKYSKEGASRYTLHLQISDDWKDDGITGANPFHIESIPYSSFWQKDGPFYLTAKPIETDEDFDTEEIIEAANKAEQKEEKTAEKSNGADYDYFTFSVDEQQILEINVIGVPGVNIMLNVYRGEEFRMVPPDMLGKSYYDNDFMGPWPMERSNNNGVGEGETLVFEAYPGEEYVLEVTNAMDFYYYSPFMYFDYYGFQEQDMVYPNSHIPYHIRIRGEQLPPDEDGFPMNMYDMYYYEETYEEVIEEFKRARLTKTPSEFQQDYYYSYYFYEKEMVQKVLEAAPSYELGTEAKGYFQIYGDIDLFKVQPDYNGIYQFSFNKTETMMPMATVLRYDEKEEMLYHVAYNDPYDYYYGGFKSNNDLFVGLEKDQTYIVMLQNFYYGPSLDEYSVNSKLILENPQDKYAPNHKPEEAVALPDNKTVKGNFAMGNEVDYFYFESDKDQLFGLTLQAPIVSEKDRNGLPEDLFKPIMPAVLIMEDIDGDGELSDEEMRNAIYFYGYQEDVTGSFNAKAGKKYFVAIMNYYYYGSGASLTPYELAIKPAPKAGAITPLKEVTKNKLSTKGYFETNHKEKMYNLDVVKTSKTTIELAIPKDIDGVLAIYDAKKKLIKSVDYYGKGDSEFIELTLEKGSYYIGVKDFFGGGSVSPYELTVNFK